MDSRLSLALVKPDDVSRIADRLEREIGTAVGAGQFRGTARKNELIHEQR